MKSMITLFALALFASASVLAIGCGDATTTADSGSATTTDAGSDTTEAGSDSAPKSTDADHSAHEHTTVSLKLPGMT